MKLHAVGGSREGIIMPVTEYLERNAREYPDEVALVELNPDEKDTRRTTWREFGLIEPTTYSPYRREITWSVFNEKANRFANMLIGRGIKKGDKVAIIMYNCLEWLPIYFGVLKTGAIAVPFNFRYDSDEIYYCAELAEVDVIVFGPQFIGRIEVNAERLSKGRLLIYVGDNCPSFAESYRELVADCSSKAPDVTITEDDYGAIYFHQEQRDFLRQYFISTEALHRLPRWSRSTMEQEDMTHFYVFRHCTIQVLSSTGWEALLQEARPYFLRELSLRQFLRLYQMKNVQSCGC